MRVLVVNAGSSSLKHAIVDAGTGEVIAAGTERWEPDGGPGRHADALRAALRTTGPVDAVGHRVVHGGADLTRATVVDADVRARIAGLIELAPLHQRAALEGIDAAALALPGVPQVACFDTAFHRTLPAEAATYAVSRAWTQRFALRRYGFHGINVQWCAQEAQRRLGEAAVRRLVVCHLGSGCSVTAVREGRSLDTTMGFTPLEGVPMATRSGSIDPGVLLHLARSGLSIDEIDAGLNHEGGLAGVSGVSGGAQAVIAAADAGDAAAALAVAIFVRGVAGAVGAMATALGGLDALVFSGGVGEHAASVRAAVVDRVAHLGADQVLVIAAGEERLIAQQAAALLAQDP